jgi:3-deoxy-D-manno-octulosonic-acid transferase
MFYFYNLLLLLLLPLLFFRLLIKQIKSKDYQKFSQQGRWKERLGFTPYFAFDRPPIWIHTVSVGEFIAILPLISLLQTKHPNIPIIITTTTMTGSDQVLNTLGDQVTHVYIPWDLANTMARFYNNIKPRAAIIMETEIWPNLLFEAKKENIPVFLINARMSEKSANSYQRIAKLTTTMLNSFAHICVQNEMDKQRFVSLGAKQIKLNITGNIKYDLKINSLLLKKAVQIKQLLCWQALCWQEKETQQPSILLAASTHPGEDELMLDLYQQLKKTHPLLKLILVPRHPERFKQVTSLAQQYNKHVVTRSSQDCNIKMPKQCSQCDVLIGDSLGEMTLYYNMADIVIMGGTFVNHGGHNILEPAALSKAIFYGDSMYNFASINKDFLAHNASIQVKQIEELYEKLSYYLDNTQLLEQMGVRAKQLIENNSGSKDKIYQILKQYQIFT